IDVLDTPTLVFDDTEGEELAALFEKMNCGFHAIIEHLIHVITAHRPYPRVRREDLSYGIASMTGMGQTAPWRDFHRTAGSIQSSRSCFSPRFGSTSPNAVVGLSDMATPVDPQGANKLRLEALQREVRGRHRSAYPRHQTCRR